MNFSCITITMLMNNMIWHSFYILLINLTMDFFFFSESNCLSKMSKLTQLNLRRNNFDKEILRSLGALPVLKSLDLSFNNMWPLSSKGTCISKFSSQEYHEKVYTKLKSYNQYLLLSKFTLFVLKGTKCFSAITNAFDICKL